jgi:hypothetical protein
MSNKARLTIGAFAEATMPSHKALRLYDESSLLAPAEVYPFSGYRYYTEPDSCWTTHRHAACRGYGPGADPGVPRTRCQSDLAASEQVVDHYLFTVNRQAITPDAPGVEAPALTAHAAKNELAAGVHSCSVPDFRPQRAGGSLPQHLVGQGGFPGSIGSRSACCQCGTGGNLAGRIDGPALCAGCWRALELALKPRARCGAVTH